MAVADGELAHNGRELGPACGPSCVTSLPDTKEVSPSRGAGQTTTSQDPPDLSLFIWNVPDT